MGEEAGGAWAEGLREPVSSVVGESDSSEMETADEAVAVRGRRRRGRTADGGPWARRLAAVTEQVGAVAEYCEAHKKSPKGSDLKWVRAKFAEVAQVATEFAEEGLRLEGEAEANRKWRAELEGVLQGMEARLQKTAKKAAAEMARAIREREGVSEAALKRAVEQKGLEVEEKLRGELSKLRKENKELRGRVDRLLKLSENAAEEGRDKGQLEALQTTVVEEIRRVEGTLAAGRGGGDPIGELKKDLVQKHEEILEEVRGAVRAPAAPAPKNEATPEGWAAVVKRGRKKRGPQVVVAPPEKVPQKEARGELVRCLDPKEGEVRVRGLRKRGTAFVVEVQDEKDLERIKGLKALKDAGFRVNGAPALRDPTIAVHGVESALSAQDVKRSLWRRNPQVLAGVAEASYERDLRVKQKAGRGGNSLVSWVIQATPALCKRLLGAGAVFVGLQVCRVREYTDVLQCFRCQRYGHIGRQCGGVLTCGRCGEEGHHRVACSKVLSGPRCANCVRRGCKEVGHSVEWVGCPSNAAERHRVRAGMKDV